MRLKAPPALKGLRKMNAGFTTDRPIGLVRVLGMLIKLISN